MITLGDEYRCIWRASCSAVSVIFFLTRYVTLFTVSLVMDYFSVCVKLSMLFIDDSDHVGYYIHD